MLPDPTPRCADPPTPSPNSPYQPGDPTPSPLPSAAPSPSSDLGSSDGGKDQANAFAGGAFAGLGLGAATAYVVAGAGVAVLLLLTCLACVLHKRCRNKAQPAHVASVGEDAGGGAASVFSPVLSIVSTTPGQGQGQHRQHAVARFSVSPAQDHIPEPSPSLPRTSASWAGQQPGSGGQGDSRVKPSFFGEAL